MIQIYFTRPFFLLNVRSEGWKIHVAKLSSITQSRDARQDGDDRRCTLSSRSRGDEAKEGLAEGQRRALH